MTSSEMNREEQELTIKEYVPTKHNTHQNNSTTVNDNSTFPNLLNNDNTDQDIIMTSNTIEPIPAIKKEEEMDDNTTDTKPYSCPKCNQTFSRPHNLKSHLTTHSEERPYQCDVCNHHFRRQHDLKRHQKLHTGERPYKCKNCTRSFARLDALNRHCKAEGGSACTLVKQQQMKQQEQKMTRIHHEAPYHHEQKKRRSEYGSDSITEKAASMTITPPSDTSPPSTANSSPVANRPVIPQLQIPHPASHLYPKNAHFIPPNNNQPTPNHQFLPSPNVILPKNLTPPVYTSQKALPITPSSPPPPPGQYQQQSNSKSPLYAGSPWASPYSPRPTLPPLPANYDIERLIKENEGLKKDINQLRSMAQKEATSLKSKIHDLQVENKVLRSLIHGPAAESTNSNQ
ncbi:hypothetical protein G6F62_008774 [Rhizopus arrhizus]|nr:hypothetical protein G6F23_002718 [Rhizopus arrhizus]KAG0765153.1 hypothetical protein G6F24_004646 [Rhizopus arrhizus]KAG0790392.1 hypothetical protein G6F21_005841 [Rhizopus arrhizus]KAG0794684.1 hypothetical protein G6F22_005290 [Rhizopus arrhizus]KAG0814490.1 hypothetical protein G6F20_004733 [Rhizopus arrhizus]